MTFKEIFALCLLGMAKLDANGEAKKCRRSDFIIRLLNKTGIEPEQVAEIIMSD